MDGSNIMDVHLKGDDLASLRTAQGQAEVARDAIAARIAEKESRLGNVLLDGGADDIAQAEAELEQLRSKHGRVAAMLSALPARIAAAEAKGAEALLDEVAVRAEADAAEAASLLAQVMTAAVHLGELVERHDVLAGRVANANRDLRAGGRERVITGAGRVWPCNPHGRRVDFLAPYLGLPGPFGIVSLVVV